MKIALHGESKIVTINGVDYDCRYEPYEYGEHAAFYWVFVNGELKGTCGNFPTLEEIEGAK